METKFVLTKGIKKHGVSVTIILFVIFILGSIALPKLAATREDALNAQAYYQAKHNLANKTANTKTQSYTLDSSLFEIKRYEVRYQTNETQILQKKIKTLKAKEYVLFDKYNESKDKSSYTLKVKREKSQEILDFLELLSPQKVHLYVENIKKSIDSSIDQEKLLKDKLSKLEVILNDATKSYSSLLVLAKEKNNIDALTKLIDLKINTLNRLSLEQNTILDKINAISKSKQELFDSLNYVIFNITIDEFLYIDTEALKNSWKYDIKIVISNFNSLGQSLTTTLLSFLIQLLKFFIYFIIMLFILKVIIFVIKKVFAIEEIAIFEKPKDE